MALYSLIVLMCRYSLINSLSGIMLSTSENGTVGSRDTDVDTSVLRLAAG